MSQLIVLCSGAAKAAIVRLAREFEEVTGNIVSLQFGTVGMLKERIVRGERYDIAILTQEVLYTLEQINSKSVVEIGKVGVGLAVRKGEMLPDTSTDASLRQSLLNARVIAYADPAKGATSGIHFAKVLEQLGISDEVNKKSLLLAGCYVIETVAEGKAELGIQQITEILPVQGVVFAGPLPAELQKVTTYGAGISNKAMAPEIAADFIRFITGIEAIPALKASGFGIF